MSDALLTGFKRHGLLGPVPLLTSRECRSLMAYLGRKRPLSAEWHKSGAISDWLLYRIAANPYLLEYLRLALGEDIILWGCSVARKHAGEMHPWHVDIEASPPTGRYASAWIGLENTRRNAGLEMIAGSHVVGKTIQQVQAERGYARGGAPTEIVLEWARERNPAAKVMKPELNDGDAIVFDGHLWHGSRNDRSTGTRTALLLQFASADSPVRMYDESRLEWPFAFVTEPKPPTIVVHGQASTDINRLVAPPPALRRKPMISTQISRLDLPLRERPGGGWQPYQLFGGPTPVVDHMNCHVSVLSPGHCPHPPHVHNEEELLIILDGEAELLIADNASADNARVEPVQPGAFAYYPAYQHHTIRNCGKSPVTYAMFKWHLAGARPAPNPIGTGVFRYSKTVEKTVSGWEIEGIMGGATGWLGHLHSHASRLAPGAGYEPHVDGYDVAILMLEGQVETLGQQVGPNGIIYYAAGRKHGMRNIGSIPAHYLVFEFHSSSVDLQHRIRRRAKSLAKQMLKRAALAVGLDLGQLRERLRRRT